MKTRWLTVTTLLLALLTSACGNAQKASTDVVLSEIYTSVAITITAAAGGATSTSAPAPIPTRKSAAAEATVPASTATLGIEQPVVSNGAVSACKSSAYMSDVTIADGTELAPGQTFTKTWEISNNGTCNWSKHYSMIFVSGDDMDGDDTEIDQVVDVGETADISVDLTAPDNPGTYTGYWSLADSSGELFGQKVYVQLVVSDDAATTTPTASPTPRATATEPTSTPTATTVPATETSTPEPTATETPAS